MKSCITVFFIAFPFFLSSQTISLNKVGSGRSNEIILAKHTFYEIGYDTKYNLPAWTFYTLTKAHLQLANLERKGSFKKDPLINFVQAKDADYSASGYDKGHLVPCEDMSFSEAAMKETFYYSNCVPQTTELNRGEWKVLEELTRNWADHYGEVIVLSGPVMEINLKSLGEDKIPVPNSFYKIILRHTEQSYKAIGFLLPNSTTTLNTLLNYVCTIDSIETLTGLDFFTDLPDNMESKFESAYELSDWDFEHHHNKPGTIAQKVSVQCKAMTKKGTRCKKTTVAINGLCKLHEKDKGL